MEKQLLKKFGINAVIVTILVLSFWFGFSKISLGIDTSNWTPYAMKKNSVVSEQLIIMCGTSGSGIVFGTTSGAWVGTPTDSTLARVFFNTATGRLEFKPSGTTTSFPFGSVTVAYLDANYATIGSVSVKLDAVGGVGTGNTFNSPILAGVGTITATFGANGLAITPAEYASVNNATGELQSQINGKQPTLVDNSPGTITNTLGYTPPANTSGSITVALGYTPPANTSGSITTALGYTPPANTAGSITTALGYTPTDLGNSIALGAETTGNTDNISEGSTNKYYTDDRVNSAVGSLSVNSHNDVNITDWTEGWTLKIQSGQVISGSSSSSVGWDGVTGSPTTNQYIRAESGTATVPIRDANGNLSISGTVGGTSTGALRIPLGTTAQRPATQAAGMLRVNQSATGTGTAVGQLATGGDYSPVVTGTQTETIEIFSNNRWFGIATSTVSLGGNIHTFNSSGTFVVSSGTITVEVLVVAGGGGGGGSGGEPGGGGGAGGLIYNNSFAVSGTVTVTVGAGGAAGVAGAKGTNGNDSVFSSLTAVGGGGGGNYEDGTGGSNGGSGGGGTNSGAGVTSGGIATVGQGSTGGTGTTQVAGSGGGGASSVGGLAYGFRVGGTGGTGTASTIAGTASVYYAGGGGGGAASGGTGGTAGLGGGGTGALAGGANATAGTANTGGGGGGGHASGATSAAGGSGVVIVRY